MPPGPLAGQVRAASSSLQAPASNGPESGGQGEHLDSWEHRQAGRQEAACAAASSSVLPSSSLQNLGHSGLCQHPGQGHAGPQWSHPCSCNRALLPARPVGRTPEALLRDASADLLGAGGPTVLFRAPSVLLSTTT